MRRVPSIEDQVLALFENGANYWKSADFVAEEVAEMRDGDAEMATADLRFQVESILRHHSGAWGPLEEKDSREVTGVQLQWAQRSQNTRARWNGEPEPLFRKKI